MDYCSLADPTGMEFSVGTLADRWRMPWRWLQLLFGCDSTSIDSQTAIELQSNGRRTVSNRSRMIVVSTALTIKRSSVQLAADGGDGGDGDDDDDDDILCVSGVSATPGRYCEFLSQLD